MKAEAKKHYDAALAHKEAGNENGFADEVDMTIVQHYIFAMQTSFPEPNSVKR